MRYRNLGLLFLFIFLSLSSAAFAETKLKTAKVKSPSAMTNVDWLLMSQKEKAYCLVSIMQSLHKQGIPLAKSPEDYAVLIDKVVDSPELKANTVKNILTSIIYANEPQSRPAINALQRK